MSDKQEDTFNELVQAAKANLSQTDIELVSEIDRSILIEQELLSPGVMEECSMKNLVELGLHLGTAALLKNAFPSECSLGFHIHIYSYC